MGIHVQLVCVSACAEVLLLYTRLCFRVASTMWGGLVLAGVGAPIIVWVSSAFGPETMYPVCLVVAYTLGVRCAWLFISCSILDACLCVCVGSLCPRLNCTVTRIWSHPHNWCDFTDTTHCCCWVMDPMRDALVCIVYIMQHLGCMFVCVYLVTSTQLV